MATTTAVTFEEYLSTSYEPDAEYVDGQILERNVGEYDHNLLQLLLVNWFNLNGKTWNVQAIQEQRTVVKPNQSRIPDVAVFPRDQPIEQVFTRPHLIAIEIISPSDRHSEMQKKIQDYIDFGIRHIWYFDPEERAGWNCSDGNWTRQEVFSFQNGSIEGRLDLNELFRKLDARELF
jgi:Uma2 family endonuclease